MSTPSDIVARVPAKVMLAGEYAVLAGESALSVALDCWLTARLTFSNEPGIRVSSNLWPAPQHISLHEHPHELRGTPLLHAVSEAAKHYGIDHAHLSIDSTIDVSHGIGSSSALRLAVTMVMAEAHRRGTATGPTAATPAVIAGVKSDPFWDPSWGAARLAVALQREAQGSASGYDVATQLVGGLVAFTGCDELAHWPSKVERFSPLQLQRLSKLVRVYVGGEGSPTAPLLKTTRAWLAAQGVWNQFVDTSRGLVAGFLQALSPTADDTDRKRLYHACAAHRTLLHRAAGFPRAIDAALAHVRGLDESFSWKTTGAGGEDAILLIGPAGELKRADAALRQLGRRPLDCMFTDSGAIVASASTPSITKPMQEERSITP